jgi:undecaprenyl-diphosphatase
VLEYLKAAVSFLEAHPYIAYGAVFLAAIFEAVPAIGAIIPGSMIIVAISALTPTGAVSFWPLICWAVLGAIIGDGFSYWLGSHYRRQILEIWPFHRYPQIASRSEAFFQRHGSKSVVLGRFVPALRPFIPLFAGILRMPAHRFYLANGLSALLWAPANVIPGVALGAALGLAAAVAGRLVALTLFILLLLWAVAWIVTYVVRKGVPHLLAAYRSLLVWSELRDTWFRRQVRSLVDPAQNETRGLALAAIILITAIWLFLGVLEDVVSKDPLVRADSALYALLQGLRSPVGDAILIAVTELGDNLVVTSVTIAVLIWFAFQRAWCTAAYWISAVALASVFNSLIRMALSRARPMEGLYVGVDQFSFPSGHATVNFVMYGFLAFLVARELRPAWSMPVVAFLSSLVALIASSRLYLGAHWFSDVAGGLAFGAAWIVVLGTAYHYHRREKIRARGLLVLAAATLALAGTANIYWKHATDTARYAARKETDSISWSDWLGGGWQRLPARRTDLIGEFEGPLTVQWVGEVLTLENRLRARGWQDPTSLTVASALNWISPAPDVRAMPALPLLQDGQAPSLIMVLPGTAEARLVLRLWPTNVLAMRASGIEQPLWVGSVAGEQLRRPIWPLAFSAVQPDANSPRDELGRSVQDGRLEARDGLIPDSTWDGRVLLIFSSDAL